MNFLQNFKLKKLQKKAKALHDKRERGEAIDIKNEINIFLAIAKIYEKHLYDKKVPFAAIYALENYRIAAILGDMNAQYEFGKRKLEMGRFWDDWAKNIHGLPIHQDYAKKSFEEAFTYLKLSEDNGNPLARRLHGLAYINGWGIIKDKEKGFQLIVDSIEEENAWDRATQIFTEIGLNSPEFFSSIMAIKTTGRLKQG